MTKTLALHRIAAKRKQEPNRHALGIASDDRAIILQQRLQQTLRDGDALVVEHHHANIFHGDGSHAFPLNGLWQVSAFHLRHLDHHLTVRQ